MPEKQHFDLMALNNGTQTQEKPTLLLTYAHVYAECEVNSISLF